jgi:hypothetical protein
MSKRRPTSEATLERSPKRRATAESKPERSTRLDLNLAVAFNLGMAMFVAGTAWDLVSPSTADAFYWWKHALSSLGLVIAGPAWVAGSNLSVSVKCLLSAAVVGAVIFTSAANKAEYEVQESLLQPWRVEANRVIHDGLGISTAALPGWSYNKQPRPLRDRGSSASGSTSLAMGDVAVFLQLTHKPNGSANAASGIVLQGEVQLLDDQSFEEFALLREQMTARRPNATILQHVHEGKLDGVPSLTYAYQDPNGRQLQEVIFRRGSCVLTLFTTAASEEDSKRINEFLQSIRFIDPSTRPQ